MVLISPKSPQSRRRPGAELDLADEVFARQRTRDMAVETAVAIISQHEVLPRLQSNRGHRVGDRARKIGLRDRLAIDEDTAASHLDRFTGQTDDPLDADPALRQLHDPDLSPPGRRTRPGIDEDPIPRGER